MIGALRISRGALRRNAQALRALVGAEHAGFVVKSNAYGHGLVEVARVLEPYANRLCVYAADEGLALRADGIAAKILVLGPVEPSQFDAVLRAKIELSLWDVGAFARDLVDAARRNDVRAGIHVKVNTGLNRMGFEPRDFPPAIDTYVGMPELALAGIFSHLAAAEEIDSPYTMAQLATFEGALASVRTTLDAAGAKPIRHLAASAAAMLWPTTRLDMTRFGIAAYGLWPSPQTREAMTVALPLEPALAYRSQLVAMREVAAGTPVGYGLTFHAPRDMRLGVVPVGYADGLPRTLSNRGHFLIDGARTPIVGRIAMNVCVVDLSNAPQARVGSAVTLIGRDGNEEVHASDWAAWSDTINYEIVARLPAEIPRTYTD